MVTTFKNVKDNVSVALAGAAGAADATIAVVTGQGAQYPAAPFYVSVDSEVMLCTLVTGDTLTVTRGQDGTTGATHPQGALVELRPVAGLFSDLATAVNVLENSFEGNTYVGSSSPQALPTVAGHTGYWRFYKALGGSLAITPASGESLVPPGATAATAANAAYTSPNGESTGWYCDGTHWLCI